MSIDVKQSPGVQEGGIGLLDMDNKVLEFKFLDLKRYLSQEGGKIGLMQYKN